MALQVKVISKETIKPSLLTPQQHLSPFNLSNIDQYVHPIRVPLILFYPANNEVENAKIFDGLKKSLPETLSRFYPLAGRIFDNQVVECNDNGVEYVETQVKGELNRVVSCPKVEDLIQLIPCDLCVPAMGSEPLLAIQVNKFDCGGLALAICVSHKIADAATLSTFVSSWAATASGSSEKIVLPQFDAATLFPPREVSPLVLASGTPTNKVVSKRFVLNASKILALKAGVSNTAYVENPTRVEAAVALLWRCALKASKDRVGFIKPSKVDLVHNLRGKMTPPLPDHSFGNLIAGAISSSLAEESEIELPCLVGKLREAKRKLDEDYIRKLPLEDMLALCRGTMIDAHVQYAKGEVELYTFTSWCRFPFYETDFGWGKPIWTTFVNSVFKNIFVLMDTKSGDGIEAWVTLDEHDMARFECEAELLAYVSVTQ